MEELNKKLTEIASNSLGKIISISSSASIRQHEKIELITELVLQYKSERRGVLSTTLMNQSEPVLS